jgi:hypothetical protein
MPPHDEKWSGVLTPDHFRRSCYCLGALDANSVV